MGCFNSIYPHEKYASVTDICIQCTILVTEITANAPFGVGIFCSTIKILLQNFQIMKTNNIITIKLAQDINILLGIIKRLLESKNQVFINDLENSISFIQEDINTAIEITNNMNKDNKILRIFLSNSNMQKLSQISDNLQNSKQTLHLAITTYTTKDPRHQIPGTNKTAACLSLLPGAEPPNNQCMIERSTGIRCTKLCPKYILTSKKGQSNSKIIYYACGHCTPDMKNAWWRKEYTRTDR